jgi:tocopherol O-methyltransferase
MFYRRNFPVNSCANIQDIVAYFDSKTRAILRRYGPGPRVHYHTGLIDNPPPSNTSAKVLRQYLVLGQERILFHAANSWNASSTLGGDVLDVGCGLGGGAIFWAQEFGARVTAATCVPSHGNWVARFAAQAGVGLRVRPVICDATKMSGENLFDAAVAIDSSGYLPRRAWFRRLATLLRPAGRVFLIDCFLETFEHEEAFNRHWHTCIGTIDEYVTAAVAAGLRLESIEDISDRTMHFWTTTLALMDAESKEKKLSAEEVIRHGASASAHRIVQQGLANRSFRYALMSFSKHL